MTGARRVDDRNMKQFVIKRLRKPCNVA